MWRHGGDCATNIGSAYGQVWWGPSTKRGKWTQGSHPLIRKMSEADNPGKGKIIFLQQGLMGLLTTLWGRSHAQEPKTDPTIFFYGLFVSFVLFWYFSSYWSFSFWFWFSFWGDFCMRNVLVFAFILKERVYKIGWVFWKREYIKLGG